MDDKGEVSDGYHTFNELYAHRIALFLALAKERKLGWKSLLHADGIQYEGWFIAGLTLPTGDITYHLPMAYWQEASHLVTLTSAPVWDGHTPADVMQRLLHYAQRG